MRERQAGQDPQLTVQGVLEGDAEDDMEDAVDAVIVRSTTCAPPNAAMMMPSLKLRIAVRRALRESVGKRPVTDVHVVRI